MPVHRNLSDASDMGCLVVLLVFFGVIAAAFVTGDMSLLWLDGWVLVAALIWFIVRSSGGPYQRS
jgi:hypothetical protein